MNSGNVKPCLRRPCRGPLAGGQGAGEKTLPPPPARRLFGLVSVKGALRPCLRLSGKPDKPGARPLTGSGLGGFAGQLVVTVEVAVETIPVGEIVQRFVQERFRDDDTPEQPEAVQQALALEYLGSFPVVSQ